MALIQNEPEDLPTTDTLAGVEDPDQAGEDGERAEIYLSGARVATLDNAPNGGGRVVLMVELEVTEEAVRFNENGDVEVPIRRCRRVGDMYRPGTARPPTKDELKAMQEAARVKAAAERAAAEEAERAEAEQNEPPMFNEDGTLRDTEPDPPADDGDQGDDNVVEFSDGKKK